ncbi:C-type lectin domain-containing protein [Chryseobacterium sp. T1]
MKKISILFFTTLYTLSFCQIGIGVQTPNQSAVVDISVANKGVVAAKINLNSLKDTTTITSPAVGLLVYNTTINDSQNLKEAYYYWDGNNWNLVGNDIKNYITKNSFTFYKMDKYLGYPLKSGVNAPTPSGYTKNGCRSNPNNGHIYCAYSSNNGQTWQTAFDMAKSLGGYLVTITNNSEWEWVKTYIIDNGTGYNLQNHIWLGFNKIQFPGNGIQLRWITGEISRRNWSNNTQVETQWNNQNTSNEPNNYMNQEGCGHIYGQKLWTSRLWNDYQCNSTTFNNVLFNNFIVEFNN